MNPAHPFLSGLAYSLAPSRSIDELPRSEPIGPEVLATFRQRGLERYVEDDRTIPEMCLTSVRETLRATALAPGDLDAIVLASSNSDMIVDDEDETALFAALHTAGFVRTRLIGLTLQACSAGADALAVAASLIAQENPAARILVVIFAQRKKMSRLGPMGNTVFSDGAVSCIVSSARGGFEICASESVTNTYLGGMGRSGNIAQFQGGMLELRDLRRRVLGRSGVGSESIRAIFGTNAGVGHLKLMAQAAGLPMDRTYDDDVPRFGHVHSCDPLLSLKNYSDKTTLVAGECFMLHVMVAARILCFGLALRRMNAPLDLRAAVVETFQQYLGTSADLPLATRLHADLGLDSLMFVTILFDLTDRLGLQLASPDTDLRAIVTVDDFVAFVTTLAPPRP